MFARTIFAACALAALPLGVHATPDYDPALEQAAIRLVVSKLGPLRGGYAYGQRPVFVTSAPPQPAPAPATDAGWSDGLAPATDLPRMAIGER
ncbi:MAG: hypothetical protein JJ913_13655 [Rhizobiaceae bacterium]|nr:hypothetical protein [Rhizobiaceae bacterium]